MTNTAIPPLALRQALLRRIMQRLRKHHAAPGSLTPAELADLEQDLDRALAIGAAIAADADTGLREVAAFLQGRPGTERRAHG